MCVRKCAALLVGIACLCLSTNALAGPPLFVTQVTLNSAPSPSTASSGTLTAELLTGTGFPAGTISPSSVAVTLTPPGGPAITVTAIGILPAPGAGGHTIEFQIPASLVVSTSTAYAISLTGTTGGGAAFASKNTAILLISPPASIASVSPTGSADPGTQVTLTIVGNYTHFANLASVVSIPGSSGISFGAVAVASQTQLSVPVTLSPSAAKGVFPVAVTTGTEKATIASAFSVNAAIAKLTIMPVHGVVPLHGSRQLTATAVRSDDTIEDVTGKAAWTSSTPGSMTVSSTGMVNDVGAGSTIITAQYAGASGSSTLTAVRDIAFSGINGGEAVTSFLLGGATGQPTLVGTFSQGPPYYADSPDRLTSVAATPNGKFVYAATYAGAPIAGFTVDINTGQLTPMAGSPFANPGPIVIMAIDPAGKYLFAAAANLEFFGGGLWVYSIDANTGALTLLPGMPLGGGAFCDGVAVDPTGSYVYATIDGQLITFSVDPASGALTQIGAATGDGPLTMDPQDRFVFVGASVIEGSNFSIGVAGIDPGTHIAGTVAAAFSGNLNFNADSIGAQGPAMAVDPTGRFLYTGTEGFLIDPLSGVLTPVPGRLNGDFSGVAVDPSGRFIYGINGGEFLEYALNSLTGSGGASFQSGLTPGGGTLVVVGVPAPAATLTSLAITPANPEIVSNTLGMTEQFTLMGTYSDGSTAFLTDSATWSSTNGNAASIAAGGLATTTGFGSTTIEASYGGLSASTTLQVAAVPLVSIALTPVNWALPVNTAVQYTATGTYADGTTQNLTNNATWSSTMSNVASVTGGLALAGSSSGFTAIQACQGSVCGNATLIVQ